MPPPSSSFSNLNDQNENEKIRITWKELSKRMDDSSPLFCSERMSQRRLTSFTSSSFSANNILSPPFPSQRKSKRRFTTFARSSVSTNNIPPCKTDRPRPNAPNKIMKNHTIASKNKINCKEETTPEKIASKVFIPTAALPKSTPGKKMRSSKATRNDFNTNNRISNCRPQKNPQTPPTTKVIMTASELFGNRRRMRSMCDTRSRPNSAPSGGATRPRFSVPTRNVNENITRVSSSLGNRPNSTTPICRPFGAEGTTTTHDSNRIDALLQTQFFTSWDDNDENSAPFTSAKEEEKKASKQRKACSSPAINKNKDKQAQAARARNDCRDSLPSHPSPLSLSSSSSLQLKAQQRQENQHRRGGSKNSGKELEDTSKRLRKGPKRQIQQHNFTRIKRTQPPLSPPSPTRSTHECKTCILSSKKNSTKTRKDKKISTSLRDKERVDKVEIHSSPTFSRLLNGGGKEVAVQRTTARRQSIHGKTRRITKTYRAQRNLEK